MATHSRRRLILAALSTALAEISSRADGGDSASEMIAACLAGNAEAVKKLISADPNLVNQTIPGGATPLLLAISSGSAALVTLLLSAGAKRDARADDGMTPLIVAVVLLTTPHAKASRAGALALLDSIPVAVQSIGTSLRDVLTQVFDTAGVPADVGAGLTVPIALSANVGLGTAILTLMRLARRAGQPIAFTITGGRLKVGLASPEPPPPVPSEVWPILTAEPPYRFYGTISRFVLEAYLSRAVTHFGLLSSSPEPATAYFDDDLRMLTNIGAKFIGRSAYSWDVPDDDEAHFRLAAERAERVHRADSDILLQAAIFETAYRKVERIPVPDWAFAEFGLPVERRTFRYESMLYDGGKFRDHWTHDASVPDMSKVETRMWFYYRARRYIDAGCEAVDFGQVHLMDQNDPGHAHWVDLLTRIRRYAMRNGRRRMVLCDAHTHGVTTARGLLFDLHAWPLRPAESPVGNAVRLPGELQLDFVDSIVRHSQGGRTPSGWVCDSLPYLVEIDNWGASGKPGRRGVGFPWVWGYDEISWFAHLESPDRDAFLRTTQTWLREKDPNGFLQMPTRRVLAAPVDGRQMYHANQKSIACPTGFGQESAIKAIWRQDWG